MSVRCFGLFVQHRLCLCALVMRGAICPCRCPLSAISEIRSSVYGVFILETKDGKCLWQGDVSHARKNQASFLNPSLQLPPRHKHYIPFLSLKPILPRPCFLYLWTQFQLAGKPPKIERFCVVLVCSRRTIFTFNFHKEELPSSLHETQIVPYINGTG